MVFRILLGLLAFSCVISSTLLGGYRNVNLDDEVMMERLRGVITEVLRELDRQVPFGFSSSESTIATIHEAQMQIVHGTNWKVKFDRNIEQCRENLSCKNKVEICDIGAWEQLTLEVVLTQHECRIKESVDHVRPEFMPGGLFPSSVDSPSVKKAAEFAIQSINAEENYAFHRRIEQILESQSQVVAGIRYYLKFVVHDTICQNLGSTLTHDCPTRDPPNRKECDVTVIEQAWMQPRYTFESSLCTLISPTPAANIRRILSVRNDVVQMEQQKNLLGGDDHDIHYGMFQAFKTKYSKQYKDVEEERKKFAIFRENMMLVRVLQRRERGSAVYGASPFADLTTKEFKLTYLTPKWDLSKRPDKVAQIPEGPIPRTFNWSDHNAVTKVKNQGSCGSCWAFSTTGNIEGQWAIRKGKLLSLSEQELVDCDKVDHGCNGGLPTQAYKEIERIGGLETEIDYKYDARGEKCRFNKTNVQVTINDSVCISKNETEMAAWLFKNGPISIGINANAMQFYMGGIAHPWKIFCSPFSLDHGVLIVGYGVQDSTPFWNIKNSWGESWGVKGYYLVYRGDGVCGLNQMCTSAVVD